MAKGRRTRRSQNYLRQYGYPSARELRREAQGLASASVPTVRQVSRPYQRQIQSTKDFLAAVNAALGETASQVGQGYDQGIAASQGVSQAAQARLAGLGLGADSAGVQAALGAGSDSATQNLIAQGAAAKNYAAQLPAVAAGQASVQAAGLRKNLVDALAGRRDQLSQAFFQALNTVQQQHLQMASFNQQSDQFQQQMAAQQAAAAEQAREFQAQMSLQERQFAYSKRSDARNARLQAAGLMAQYGYDVKTGKFVDNATGASALAHKLGLTPAQVNEMQSQASGTALKLLQNGQSWDSAIKILETQGIDPQIAKTAVVGTYSYPPNPPPAPPKMVYSSAAGKNVANPDYQAYQATMKRIRTATSQFLASKQAAQILRFYRVNHIPSFSSIEGQKLGAPSYYYPNPAQGTVGVAEPSSSPGFYGRTGPQFSYGK